MKRMIALLLMLLVLFPALMASADTDNANAEAIIIPANTEWEMTRTKFKSEHTDVSFTTITIGDYKGLYRAGFQVEGYVMDGYYEFTIPVKNSYGLSRVVYILDVSKKLSNAKLNACYDTLVNSVSSDVKPVSSSDTETVWVSNGATMHVAIGAMTAYNGSKNKAVYISFEAPGFEAAAPTNTPKTTKKATKTPKPTATPKPYSGKMTFSAEATCGNYNHVGNTWYKRYYINGQKIDNKALVAIKPGDKITVKAQIIENDKSPDYGQTTTEYTVTEKDVQDGFSLQMKVRVTEDKGRYSGYTAVWDVKLSFTP